MPDPFPVLLRALRRRQRRSQEDLALEAEVSARHLSCLETGKSGPSREMVVRLSAVLGLELRERNALLVSAGFAPVYAETPLGAEAMVPVNRAIEFLLAQQEPYAAVLIDPAWNVLRANGGARRLLSAFLDGPGVPADLAANLVRATLHPEGLRRHVVNWDEVSGVVLERVERAHHAHPTDPARRALLDEVRRYPGIAAPARRSPSGGPPVAALHLRRGRHELRLFTLLTSIGTPLDVTAQELTVETLFPADDATERWFRAPDGAAPRRARRRAG